MSFAPADFAAVADHLRAEAGAGRVPVEAAQRVAIGRYYYAALLTARDYIDATESTAVDRSRDTHAWVIAKLKQSGEHEAQLVSRSLASLKEVRNIADYGQDLKSLATEAGRAASLSERARSQVATLMKRHRR